jgi:hypothetical protein
MLAHGWGQDLKDVGDQALMRGLATAFPSVRPGLSLSYCGRRLGRPQTVDGGSPAVDLPRSCARDAPGRRRRPTPVMTSTRRKPLALVLVVV